MVNKRKSTKGVHDFTDAFSRRVVQENNILRDGKEIVVAGRHPAFTKKNPAHVSLTLAAFDKLKKAKLEKVRIVPVKTYPNNIQKYFQRPSLLTLHDYCAFKLDKRVRLPPEISALDIRFCEALLKKYQNITVLNWYNKSHEAILEIGNKVGFGAAFFLTVKGRQHLVGSSFENFVVFGLDGQGTIKVGVVDV